jgi:SAM-dependent methyltransferase
MSAERAPHAALDDESRVQKAAKIVAQLRAERPLEGADVLDVGCGNGVIAREFARAVGSSGSVVGVDVVDQRTTVDGYRFEQVSGTTLPFADGGFDIVVSNHCIEHVGDRTDQLNHLLEVGRVLRDGGICYLAVPNRWTLVEPHFRLPFLSWLPKSTASAVVRLAGRGTEYDCDIPSSGSLAQLVSGAGLQAREITITALPLIEEIERPHGLRKILLRTPPGLAARLTPLMPTRMYILSHCAS